MFRRGSTALVALLAVIFALSATAVRPGTGLLAALLPGSPPELSVETPRRAFELADSVGVNTHLGTRLSAYDDFGRVRDALLGLGVRHIRQGLWVDRPDQHDELRVLAADGIRSDLVAGSVNDAHGTLDEILATLRGGLASVADAVEGPNEYDFGGGDEWADELRVYQQMLYTSMKLDPALSGLPVYAPALRSMTDPALLGDVSGMSDFNNRHTYPVGEPPEANVDEQLALAAESGGTEPLVVSETGYHNNLTDPTYHDPVPEEVAGTYVPRLVLEHFRKGIARTYLYELVDQAQLAPYRPQVAFFGLVHADFTPKPAYTSLRNLLAVVADGGDGAAAFTPTPLELAIEPARGADPVTHLLLQKTDGTYLLVVWRPLSVWDTATRSEVRVPRVTVSVDLARTMSGVRYEPVTAANGRSLGNRDHFTLRLAADPVVLALR